MRVALLGYGRMGRAVEAVALDRGHEVVARLGRAQLADAEADGGEALAARVAGAHVLIDFSHGPLVAPVARAAARARVPLVSGTTGLPDGALDALREAGERGIGVVYGPNFSLGVQLYFRTARLAARLFGRAGGYDVHVHEAHHRHKVDHPSGTARHVADIVVEESPGKNRWAPAPPDARPSADVLYVSSTRAGEIPGTHTLGFEGAHDRLEVTHEARGRDGFASGAVRAAEWVVGRSGFFTFEEVVDRVLADEDRMDENTSSGRDA